MGIPRKTLHYPHHHQPKNGQKRRKESYQEIRQERRKIQIQNHQEGGQERRQEESQESHQEEKGQEDPHCRQEVVGLEGHPRQNRRWSHQEGPQEVQIRQDRLQKAIRSRSEENEEGRNWQVAQGRPEGQKGPETYGLRRLQERYQVLQNRQEVL